ncbi:MAG: FHA domain-containing protein [Eubacterium sp.]
MELQDFDRYQLPIPSHQDCSQPIPENREPLSPVSLPKFCESQEFLVPDKKEWDTPEKKTSTKRRFFSFFRRRKQYQSHGKEKQVQLEEYDGNEMTEVLDDPFIPRIELVQENNDNHYWISTNIFKFGRYPECDGVIDESFVSGEHCQIRYYEGQSYLMDLGSSNGTFLNGQRLKKDEWYPIVAGNRIGITMRLSFKVKNAEVTE